MPAAPRSSIPQPQAPPQSQASSQLQAPPQPPSPPNRTLSFRAEQADGSAFLSLLREVGLRSREISLGSRYISRAHSLATSLRAGRQQKRDQVRKIFFRESLRVVRRHQRFARLFVGTKFRFFKRVQLLPRIQHLHRKTVFIEHHALQLGPL